MHFVQRVTFLSFPSSLIVYDCKLALKTLGVTSVRYIHLFPATPLLCFWDLPSTALFSHK